MAIYERTMVAIDLRCLGRAQETNYDHKKNMWLFV